MNVTEHDTAPMRIDLVLRLWTKIARTVDALRSLGVGDLSSDELRAIIDATAEEADAVVHPDLERALRVLGWQDNMHAGDWLRMRAAEAMLPRRKQALVTDLQIRLKGVQAKRIVMSARTEEGSYHCTVRTFQGDVVSARSDNFVNALNGAIEMAGARKDGPDEEG